MEYILKFAQILGMKSWKIQEVCAMQSPFDLKNPIATALDRLAVRLFLFLACVAYFFFLWHSGVSSLLAGSALFILLLLTLMLLERRTLKRRDRALRERIGGAIALEELVMMPGGSASETVCRMLCDVLDAEPLDNARMRYEEEVWLVRCAQCLPGSSAGEGDVLNAHRARIEAGADRCALASTGGFSPAATRAGEWMDPPVRLIPGRQLAILAGRQHPASDEEIARHARRQRTPFSWRRIRALALSPVKLRRYLLCAFLLMLLYLLMDSPVSLTFSIASFVLAILCARENRLHFRL